MRKKDRERVREKDRDRDRQREREREKVEREREKDTVDRCLGCIVRQIGMGLSPLSTGKRLLCFKTLWLNLRGDRTGMRAVFGDRALQHQGSGRDYSRFRLSE